MGVIRDWDYQYQFKQSNPKVDMNIDEMITKAFVSKERSPEQIEQFLLWGSMSKEKEKIMPIINSYQVELQNQNQIGKSM